MSTLLISFLTFVLLLISAFVILIVLMQRTSQSGGMGAALGGGAAESAFGSETNNVLTKATIYGIIAFFLVALGLYLLYQMSYEGLNEEVDMSTLMLSQQADRSTETSSDENSAPVSDSEVMPKVEPKAEVISESVDNP